MNNSITFPLSSSQQIIYFSTFRDKIKDYYNIPLLLEVQKTLNKERLYFTFNELGKLYPLLYLRLCRVDNEIKNMLTVKDIPISDIFMQSETQMLEEAIRLLSEPFDLFDVLFKVYLFKISGKKEKNYLYIVHHHLMTDIFPTSFFYDFNKIYFANKEKGVINSQNNLLKCHYIEFSNWEREYLNSFSAGNDRSYWLNQFRYLSKHHPVLMEAPLSAASNQREVYSVALDVAIHNKMITKAKSLSISLFSIYLAALFFHLYQMTKKSELMLSTVISRRFNKLFQQTLGDFTNRIILQAQVPNNINDHFLVEVFKNFLLSLQYSHYPYLELIQDLTLDNVEATSVFDKGVSIIFHYEENIPPFIINHSICQRPNEPLNIEIIKRDADTIIHFKYQTHYFSKEKIMEFSNCYTNIICSIINAESSIEK